MKTIYLRVASSLEGGYRITQETITKDRKKETVLKKKGDSTGKINPPPKKKKKKKEQTALM